MIFNDDGGGKFNWWLILMVWWSAVLATSAPLSPTKKRTLFSRLPLSEPTIITCDALMPSPASGFHQQTVRNWSILSSSAQMQRRAMRVFRIHISWLSNRLDQLPRWSIDLCWCRKNACREVLIKYLRTSRNNQVGFTDKISNNWTKAFISIWFAIYTVIVISHQQHPYHVSKTIVPSRYNSFWWRSSDFV